MTDTEFIDHAEYVLVDKDKLAYMEPKDFDRLIGIAKKGDSFFQDAMKLAGQVDRYEKAIKLMMIQCGLPDAGDACRAVIKTGKETLEDKE